MWQKDLELHNQLNCPIAGIDEVGRGSICGPVLAAAFIPGPDSIGLKVADSKKLTARRRESLYWQLINTATSFSIGIATAEEIDEINILEATRLAMIRAVRNLSVKPGFLIIDGNARLNIDIEHKTVIGGDDAVGSIASASIIAKVTRDFLMSRYAITFKDYGLEKNMGYGTRQHLSALELLGPTPIHRKSFRCVSQLQLPL